MHPNISFSCLGQNSCGNKRSRRAAASATRGWHDDSFGDDGDGDGDGAGDGDGVSDCDGMVMVVVMVMVTNQNDHSKSTIQ